MHITLKELAAVGYVASAAISTMPPKGTQWDWETVYGWLYDCAHMVLNSRPTPHNSQ